MPRAELEFPIRVSEKPKPIRFLPEHHLAQVIYFYTRTVYLISISELKFGATNVISFSVSCTYSAYFLLVTLVYIFVGKVWKRQQCQKLSLLRRPFILRPPPPFPSRNLIPITAKVAPSFPARVGGVMMTRYLRDKRVLRSRAVDGVDRDICRSKYILLFLRFHFDFPLSALTRTPKQYRNLRSLR
jgi:hypothetical protein